jgi:hypothetical protein
MSMENTTDGKTIKTDRTTKAASDPGWSNSAPHDGISSTEPPPGERDMHAPGWSNDPVVVEAPPPPPATGATAGTPGSWTPAGAAPPADFAALGAITATPLTAWTTGQHVVLGDASNAFWDGAAWAAGQAA